MDSFKKFEILEHPSDIGIKAYAGTVKGLFEISAEAMFSIICDFERIEKSEKIDVRLWKDCELDLDELMLLWLEKLLYLHEVKMMLFSSFKISRLDISNGISRLDAKAFGEKIDILKHEILLSIKAPTYHMLEVKRDNTTGLWTGQVIFDV